MVRVILCHQYIASGFNYTTFSGREVLLSPGLEPINLNLLMFNVYSMTTTSALISPENIFPRNMPWIDYLSS